MKKRLLIGLLTLAMVLGLYIPAAAAEAATPFLDVSPTAWYAEEVTTVYELGLMNGTGNGNFSPDDTLTRAMFITVLGRFHGVNPDNYNYMVFADAPVDTWYGPYVSWAHTVHIVEGTGNGFGSNDPITREQMATIIARYVNFLGAELLQCEDPVPSFQDANEVSSWAVEGLEMMRLSGIIKGDQDQYFHPQDQAKRAEAAGIFVRLKSALDSRQEQPDTNSPDPADLPMVLPGESAAQISKYVDENGDIAIIPKDFMVSEKEGEHTVKTGVVVIGPDGSEFVWVPTAQTELAVRDFGSYFYGNSLSGYWDETELALYQDMVKSVEQYGGFYIGRFEASCGGGDNVSNYIPASKRLSQPWVRFSPQDTAVVCQNLYAENETVQGFFPWGINYDTTLQWLIDSGCKTESEVTKNSTSWGNYSNDTFSREADGSATGKWEETCANNIYDLAGNNWEWTQERYESGNFVMRGGGFNLMGGSCSGAIYPAALRDPLPGNDHHPNVTFRVALFVILISN